MKGRCAVTAQEDNYSKYNKMDIDITFKDPHAFLSTAINS